MRIMRAPAQSRGDIVPPECVSDWRRASGWTRQRGFPPPRTHLGPEGLAIVDATHPVVVNDHVFPYSSGRAIGRPDTEFTLLDVRELVAAM